MFFLLLCKVEEPQCSMSSMSQAVAAEGKIQDGPLDIITIGFVAKFYPIWICITFL